MADKHNDDADGISRREFGTRLGVAAGIAVGSEFFSGTAQAAPAPHVGGRILGANDRVVTASIGIRGQGNSLKRGFARLKNVEIKTHRRRRHRDAEPLARARDDLGIAGR